MKILYPTCKVLGCVKVFAISFFMLLASSTGLQAQFTQLGADINGEADNDASGYAVATSSDGQTVAIGAGDNDAGGIGRGHVRVYKYISGTWTQQGADIDGITNDSYAGWSVALSANGQTVAIAAPRWDSSSMRGQVRVFSLVSGVWVQQGDTINGENNGDGWAGLGLSLSADGKTVAIGASANSGGGSGRGHVRVYKFVSGSWTQQGVDIEGEADNDQSGYSVSLSADGLRVAIGAIGNAGPGGTSVGRGHVRVYSFATGSWTQIGSDLDGEADYDGSGYSVSLSSDGNVVAIGARNNRGGSTSSGLPRGHVRVYKLASGVWSQVGADIDGEGDNDQSGESVSLNADGTLLAIGASRNLGSGVGPSGHVRIYKWSGTSWSQEGTDIDGAASSDNSGWSVSLSSDGSTVAIGSPVADGGGTSRGHVRVFSIGTAAPAPEIDVQGNSNSIANGDDSPTSTDHTYFGHVSTFTSRTFTIHNTGTAALNLTGSPIVKITGRDGADFTVSTLPSTPINAGENSTFTVNFIPGSVGVKKATIMIASNDADENPYTFAIQVNYFHCAESLLQFNQLGSSINGKADNDNSGYAVSLSADGSTVAIGSSSLLDTTKQGSVRVYKQVAGVWTQVGMDIVGEAAGDYFGSSISLGADGSTLAIGAHGNAGGGATNSRRGSTKVYRLIGSTWTQLGTDIDGEADNDRSGYPVVMSKDGSTLAIGAAGNNGGGTLRGRTKAYQFTAGAWAQIGANIDGEADGDRSGIALDINVDGTVLAIGAQNNAGGGTQRGHVRVYRMVAGTWTPQGADIDGEADDDISGRAVCLSADGRMLAIGARANDGGGNYSGHVRMYQWGGVSWTQVGADLDGEAATNQFGSSISLSDDGHIVAIGGPGNAGGGLGRGHVRVFRLDGGTWIQRGTDIEGETNNEAFGVAVSLSADGGKLAVGADWSTGGGIQRGKVKVVEWGCPVAAGLPSELNSTRTTVNTYPNPFDASLLVNTELKTSETAELSVMDVLGKVVYKAKLTNAQTVLDLGQLSSGIYHLTVNTQAEVRSLKIVKQ